jgi:hypothetical protein
MASGELLATQDTLSENMFERNVLNVLFCAQVHLGVAMAKREKRKQRGTRASTRRSCAARQSKARLRLRTTQQLQLPQYVPASILVVIELSRSTT